MASLVVDASVGAAWFLPDEATAFTEVALAATVTGEVWVPALWLLEIGNMLLSAQRRKRITAAKREELAQVASALRLRIDREPVSIAAIDLLAARHQLSSYDAAYLELALRHKIPLATLDAALLKAMPKEGVAAAVFG